MSDKIIKISCKGSDLVDFRKVVHFQGNLKDLSKENYEKLRNSILVHGFAEPITAWNKNGEIVLASGHQRIRTIKNMVENEGYDCPPIPISWVYPKDEADFSRIVLSLASQYGGFTNDGVYEYMQQHKIDTSELEKEFRFPEIDMNKFMENYFNDPVPEETITLNLSDRFMIPPFSILNAREGWWQNRKRAWIDLGIKSELGRGGDGERERESKQLQISTSSLQSSTLGAIASNAKDLFKMMRDNK